MDKPSTYQDPQEQPVQPNQLDIDPMDTQQPAAKVPGDATVNPKAAQGEEDVVEIEQKAAGEKEATASPFTSQPTHKHKATNDDGDEESKAYKAFSRAAAETWRDSVIKATTDAEARQAYDTLYDTLYNKVLPKQPGFTYAHKDSVLNSILKLDGTYMMDDDAETWYTERVGEEPGKTAVDRDQEKAVKEAVVKVHDAVLQACDSLKVVHQSLCELGKVAPLDLYLKVVMEQKIPNVNVVIKVAQSVPQQPTHGDMVVKYHLPTPSKVAMEGEATRQMATFMCYTMYNMLHHKPTSQEKGCKLFDCQYTSFCRTVSGRKQLGGS